MVDSGLHTAEVNREKLLGSWWFLAVLFGAPFGVVMGLFGAHRRHESGLAVGLTAGVIGGVFFGLAMSWITRRQRQAWERRTAAFTAGLTAEGRTSAIRAARRGRVPADPAIRAAVAGLTRDQLEQSVSQRGKNLAIFGGIGLLELVMAMTSSPWFWLAVVMFAALFVAQLLQSKTLHRRLARLAAA